MSFRGRGGFRGGRGGFRGGRGGFRGGSRGGGNFNRNYNEPPDSVVELGALMHTCQDDLVCKCTNEKIPYFNAPVYLENKSRIGKVDEIFGQIRDFCFSVKLEDNMKAGSFSKDSKFYIDPMKLLPLQRFLPKPPGSVQKGRGRGAGGRGRGGRGGGFRGGRGGFRGGGSRGRGGFRGGRGRGGGGFRGRR